MKSMSNKINSSAVSSSSLDCLARAATVAFLLAVSEGRAALVGFYSFDDAALPLKDESGMGNDLQGGIADPTYITNGFQGGAFSFDGSQRLVSPIDINATTLPALTMGAWVRTSTLSPGLRKVIGQDDGGWDRVIGLDDRNGAVRYTSFTGTGPAPGTPGPVSTTDWTFLAATYDEVGTQVIVYVDLDASTVGPLTSVTNATLF